MPLTDVSIKNAPPKDKPYKMTDKDGLYLLVKKAGKYFRYDYRFQGKRKTYSIGVYPTVTLKEAREKLHEAKKLLQNGIDPVQHKKETTTLLKKQATNGFETVAREWFSKKKHIWKHSHARTIISRLENNVFPWLGDHSVSDITAPDLLKTLRRIEDRRAYETAHRVRSICSQVFRYAIAIGKAERDPAADLRGALQPTKPKHMATITDPMKIGALLRAIDSYEGQFTTKCALKLAPLVFVRPGELRHAEWDEMNIEKAEWKIPAEKTKMASPHIIPLATQAIEILSDIEPMTGNGKYVFPSIRTSTRPMSDNTILAALRRMGYANEEMTGHGFRAMASTLLHEQGYPSDWIERQLAHAEENKVKAAYNYAQYLEERKKMMQEWADYLYGLMEAK
jgi:integrase